MLPKYFKIADKEEFFELIKQYNYSWAKQEDSFVLYKKNKPFKDTIIRLSIPRSKRIKKTHSHNDKTDSKISSQNSPSRDNPSLLRQKLEELKSINNKVEQGNSLLRKELSQQSEDRQATFENLIRLLFIVAFKHNKRLFKCINEFLSRKDFIIYPTKIKLNRTSVPRFAAGFVFRDCQEVYVQDSILKELKQLFCDHFETRGKEHNTIIEPFTMRRTEECGLTYSNKKVPKFNYIEIEPLSVKDLIINHEYDEENRDK